MQLPKLPGLNAEKSNTFYSLSFILLALLIVSSTYSYYSLLIPVYNQTLTWLDCYGTRTNLSN